MSPCFLLQTVNCLSSSVPLPTSSETWLRQDQGKISRGSRSRAEGGDALLGPGLCFRVWWKAVRSPPLPGEPDWDMQRMGLHVMYRVSARQHPVIDHCSAKPSCPLIKLQSCGIEGVCTEDGAPQPQAKTRLQEGCPRQRRAGLPVTTQRMA